MPFSTAALNLGSSSNLVTEFGAPRACQQRGLSTARNGHRATRINLRIVVRRAVAIGVTLRAIRGQFERKAILRAAQPKADTHTRSSAAVAACLLARILRTLQIDVAGRVQRHILRGDLRTTRVDVAVRRIARCILVAASGHNKCRRPPPAVSVPQLFVAVVCAEVAADQIDANASGARQVACNRRSNLLLSKQAFQQTRPNWARMLGFDRLGRFFACMRCRTIRAKQVAWIMRQS
jgi:hypothetical protein